MRAVNVNLDVRGRAGLKTRHTRTNSKLFRRSCLDLKKMLTTFINANLVILGPGVWVCYIDSVSISQMSTSLCYWTCDCDFVSEIIIQLEIIQVFEIITVERPPHLFCFKPHSTNKSFTGSSTRLISVNNPDQRYWSLSKIKRWAEIGALEVLTFVPTVTYIERVS